MLNQSELDSPKLEKKYCSHEKCFYNKNLAKNIQFLTCPNCKKKTYHSEICFFNDSKHFSLCAIEKFEKLKKSIIIRFKEIPSNLFINSKEIEIDYNKGLGSGGFGDVKNLKKIKISGL